MSTSKRSKQKPKNTFTIKRRFSSFLQTKTFTYDLFFISSHRRKMPMHDILEQKKCLLHQEQKARLFQFTTVANKVCQLPCIWKHISETCAVFVKMRTINLYITISIIVIVYIEGFILGNPFPDVLNLQEKYVNVYIYNQNKVHF